KKPSDDSITPLTEDTTNVTFFKKKIAEGSAVVTKECKLDPLHK
ncbi:4918_t:CDS:2, partial [Cetraspora pellucida]